MSNLTNALVAQWEQIPEARLQTLVESLKPEEQRALWQHISAAITLDVMALDVGVSSYFWPCTVSSNNICKKQVVVLLKILWIAQSTYCSALKKKKTHNEHDDINLAVTKVLHRGYNT